MAVVLVSSSNRYVGLAADSKPTAAAGSTFYATDTNVEYITDGSNWTIRDANGGNVASGATDSGNPVKVGGVHHTTLPTLTNGQRGDLELTNRGLLPVELHHSAGAMSENVGGTASADGVSNAFSSIIALVRGQVFNGTTWDRQRGNFEATALASAARTATASSADQVNYNGRMLSVVINVSALADTPSVVPTIEGKDPISGTYYTILTGAAIVATGITVLRVAPGITPVANVAVADMVPRTFRVTMTHADTDSITYSVAAVVGV